jgi:MFS family permease
VVGGILFVPAIGAVLYALTRSPQWGWLDLRTGSLLVGSALLLWLWVRHELRHPSPLIDVRLLAQPQIALANIAFALIAAGAMQLGLVLFPLLQQPLWTGVGLGLTATLSGVVKLPSNLIAILGGTWSGAMAARLGARVPMLIGTGLLTASWGALVLYHESVWFIIAATIVAGLGMSMSYAAVPNLIVEVAPTERTSEATGMSTVTRAAAMAVGAQVVAHLMASSTVSDPALGSGAYPTAESYQLAIGFIAVCSLLAFVVSLRLPKRAPSVRAEAEAVKVA